jgi:hypothetical protein
MNETQITQKLKKESFQLAYCMTTLYDRADVSHEAKQEAINHAGHLTVFFFGCRCAFF